MISSFSSPVIVCRPALPRDKADVLEFTKFTWDFDRDYIKYVWDDWLADPHGFLAAAEYGGRCVGIAKATLITAGEWWLQGFRVDPKQQGQHIGSHIHEFLDRWWLAHGDGTVRFMTSSTRFKVHHLADKLGYQKILEMKELEAPVLDEPCEAFKPVKSDEIQEALGFAKSAPILAESRGLFDIGWHVVGPDQERLLDIQSQELAFWWRGREGLLLAWEHGSAEGKVLGIGLPVCRPESLHELLRDALRLAAQKECVGAFWIAPLKEGLLSVAEAAGFLPHREHDNFVYQKRHPARP